jgi:hypothetical protein
LRKRSNNQDAQEPIHENSRKGFVKSIA